MRFLLFVPDRKMVDDEGKSISLETVAKLSGFDDLMGGHDVIGLSSEDSPTGEPGKLIAWRKVGDNQMIVKKSEQTWVTNEVRGYSVGMWNNSPPTEVDLRREITQRGEFIGFGEPEVGWKITRPEELDSKVVFTPEGDPRFVPISKYSHYTDAIDAAVKISEEDGRQVMRWTSADAAKIVMMSLRLNYRLLPEVANHIGLFSASQIDRAFRKIMDMAKAADGE